MEQKEAKQKIEIDVVISGDGKPNVVFEFGAQSGTLTTKQARRLAFELLEAAADGDVDSRLVKWSREKMDLDEDQSLELLKAIHEKRINGSSIFPMLNIDGDPMTPKDLRAAGKESFAMASFAESEAYLIDLIVKDLGKSISQAQEILQQIRRTKL